MNIPDLYLYHQISTSFKKISLLTLFAGIFLFGYTGSTSAQTIYVDQSATGNNDGSSWNDAYTTLQAALSNASGSNEIWIAAGTYYPDEGAGQTEGDRTATFTITGNQNGLEMYGGFAGTESSRGSRNPDQNPVILSGDIDQDDNTFDPGTDSDSDTNTPSQTDHIVGGNSYSVMVLDGTTAGNITSSTVIDGVTITGGKANASEGAMNETLRQNGAAIIMNGNGSGNECSPTLVDLEISGNYATSSGGAIYAYARNSGVSSPVLYNTRFIGNTADGSGGAISMISDGSGSSSKARINASLFKNNYAAYHGGAVDLTSRDNATTDPDFINTVFLQNTAEDRGGAIYNNALSSNGTAHLTAVNSTFYTNSADYGGAIYNINRFGSTAEANLSNNIIWGNTAQTSGDQIYNSKSGATVTVANTLLEGGVASIINSDSAWTTNDGGNLSSDPQFLNTNDPDGADDEFGTGDDGLRITTSSPVLGSGDNSKLPADDTDRDDDGNSTENIPFDITGADRVQNSTVDMGAYEGGTPTFALSGFSPSASYADSTVTITGSLLTNTSDVSVGGTSVPFTVNSSTQITITLSNGASTGQLQLTRNGQTVSSSSDLGIFDGPYGSGSALQLDGAQTSSAEHVEIPDNAALDMTGAFTAEAWINWDGSSGFRVFMSKPAAPSQSRFAFVIHDGNIRSNVITTGGPRVVRNDDETFPSNQWTHVATTYDGTVQTLFVNGIPVETVDHGTEEFLSNSDQPLFIGREFPPGNFDDRTFPGSIDQVRIWDDDLTREQIHARMHQTISPGSSKDANLKAVYRFDGSGSTNAYDFFGTNPGTLKNSPSRIAASPARLGQASSVATNGSNATSGTAGGQITAQNVPAIDTVQVYQYGAKSGDLRSQSDDGEDLASVYPTNRSNMTWGISSATSVASDADITIDYSGISNISEPAMLLYRNAPGSSWGKATGWTHDAANQKYTFSGTVNSGEYAVAERLPMHVDASNGDDNNSGTSWAQPFATIQKALQLATSQDEIWIAEGVYKPGSQRTDYFTITGAQDGLEIYGGFTNGDAFADRNPAAHKTILSGDIGDDDHTSADGITEDVNDINGGNSYHVMFLDGESGEKITSETIIDGLIITGGHANGSGTEDDGGGMYCQGENNECSPILSNVRFIGNRADYKGGALYINARNGVGNLDIRSSVFIRNKAVEDGGALFIDANGGSSRPQITNTLFAKNSADQGGAIYNDGYDGIASPVVSNSTIFDNAAASQGGALFSTKTYASETETELTNAILWGNTAPSNPQIYNFRDNDHLRYTLIEGGCPSSSNCGDGSTIITQNPQFVDSDDANGADNTFFTDDDGFRLQTGSPAIDAGKPDTSGLGIANEDLRTNQRVKGTVDLGPYESGVSITLSGSEGWRMMAPPLAGQSYADMLDDLWIQSVTGGDSDRGSANLLTWNRNTSAFTPAANMANTPGAGNGFLVYVFSDDDYDGTGEGFPKELTVSGNEPSGPVNLEVKAADADDSGELDMDEGWNMLGNPYATPISVDEIIAAAEGLNNEVNTSIYVWDSNSNSYQEYPEGGGHTIAPGQGFWLRYTVTGVDGNFALQRQTAKAENATFLKPSKQNRQIVFNLSRGQELQSSFKFILDDESQTGLDRHDAYSLEPLSSEYVDLYGVVEGIGLAHNRVPSTLEEPLTLPLHTETALNSDKNTTELKLDWKLENLPGNWGAVLHDRKTGAELNLLSQNRYRFNQKLKETKANVAQKTFGTRNSNTPAGISINSAGEQISGGRFTLHIGPGVATHLESKQQIPSEISLKSNYPNPFNPVTTIRYGLPNQNTVKLTVYNALGRKIETLVNSKQNAGHHRTTFDGDGIASGIYFYRLTVGGNVVQTRKMMLVK